MIMYSRRASESRKKAERVHRAPDQGHATAACELDGRDESAPSLQECAPSLQESDNYRKRSILSPGEISAVTKQGRNVREQQGVSTTLGPDTRQKPETFKYPPRASLQQG